MSRELANGETWRRSNGQTYDIVNDIDDFSKPRATRYAVETEMEQRESQDVEQFDLLATGFTESLSASYNSTFRYNDTGSLVLEEKDGKTKRKTASKSTKLVNDWSFFRTGFS